MLEVVKENNDLEEYLGFLYGNESGFIYAPTRDVSIAPTEKDYWTQHWFEWPAQRGELIAHIQQVSDNKDIYCSPSIFSAPDAHKEFVKGSFVYWCEHDDGRIPTDLKGIPNPSLVINSSAFNQHWYWRLEKFNSDIKNIEKVNRGIAYLLGADSSGWDVNQVLRPPNTINQKRHQRTNTRSLSPWMVNPSSFSIIPEAPTLSVEFTITDLLDTAKIIAKYPWDAKTFDIYRTKEVPDRSIALMNIGYHCAEIGMDDQEIFSILYSADERWGKFRGRADRARRLNDIVAVARNKYPLANDSFLIVRELEVFGLTDLLDAKVNIEWVIPNMLEKSGQLIVSSKPGVGKTQISLRFAIAAGLGKSFLHYTPTEPMKTIFFSLEMYIPQLKWFLEQMSENLSNQDRLLLQENLLLVPLGHSLYMGNRVGQGLVESLLEKHQPSGYFIDSLGRTTPASMNDDESLKAVLDWDAAYRVHSNMFSWYVHHNRKATIGNRKPKALDDLLGSSVIQQLAESVYILWKDKPTDQTIEVINVKQRLAPEEEPYIIVRKPGLNFIEETVLDPEINTFLPEGGVLGLPAQASSLSTPPSFTPGMGY